MVRAESPPAIGQERPAPHSGLIVVGDEDGRFVGYVRESMIHPGSLKEYVARVNARTMWPVTDWDGNVVGYVAPDVPFVALAETQKPGFDIEAVRAARNGGCEDQIGDPSFKQKFPPCDNGSTGD